MVGRGAAWRGMAGRGKAIFFQREVRVRKSAVAEVVRIGGESPTNGAESAIEAGLPYMASVAIEGSADVLFHRWNCEAVEAKSKAAKGSKAKKSDDLETYVYRNEAGNLCMPGEYLRCAIIEAARYRQDPRSPRKSARDLFKAGVVCLTPLADLGTDKLDYEDRRRVVIQRNAITRVRPALRSGWRVEIDLMVVLPEYIADALLQDVVATAGRLVGVGDFRPTYGRFTVVGYEVRRALVSLGMLRFAAVRRGRHRLGAVGHGVIRRGKARSGLVG